MRVRLLAVDNCGHSVTEHMTEDDAFDVQVLIEVDGAQVWHRIRVEPGLMPGTDAALLVASRELQNIFRLEQYALSRICRLVSSALYGSGIHLPQQVAA